MLRMKEGSLDAPREVVVARIEDRVRAHSFVPVLTGGLFRLQGQLSEIVRSSAITGLLRLTALVVLLSLVISRFPAVAAAMVVSIGAVPVLLLGTLGWLAVPLDIISTPAATVAMAIGLDDMIHLVFHVRRQGSEGPTYTWRAWVEARQELWPAAVGSSLIISLGFSMLLFSSFVPTQRLVLDLPCHALDGLPRNRVSRAINLQDDRLKGGQHVRTDARMEPVPPRGKTRR